MSVCRVCLVADMRMKTIDDVQLLEIYEKLTNTKLNTDDGKPNIICYICYSQLQKSRSFAMLAQKSDEYLENILQNQMEVTPETIATLNKDFKQTLSITNLEGIHFNGRTLISIKEEIVYDNTFINEEYTHSDDNIKTENINIEYIDTEHYAEDSAEEYAKTEEINIEEDVQESIQEYNDIETNNTPNIRKKKSKRNTFKKQRSKNDCSICSKKFTCATALKKHIKTFHRDSQFACHTCDEKFTSQYEFKNHISKHKPYRCVMCNVAFTQAEKFDKHMLTHKQEDKYSCSMCTMKFPIATHILNHIIETHNGETLFGCNKCDKKILDECSLKNHKKLHSNIKSIVCKICHKAFTYQTNLNNHILVHHKNQCFEKTNGSGKPIDSEKTNASEKTIDSENTSLVESSILDKVDDDSPHILKPYTCTMCNISFTEIVKFEKHKLKHTQEAKYSCLMCPMQFSMTSHFINHMQVKHEGNNLFSCNHCDKKFINEYSCKRHNLIHSDKKPFVCKVCFKGFVLAGALKRHMYIHANIKQFACDKCDKRYNDLSGLTLHLQRHVDKSGNIKSGDEKPYRCEMCKMSFAKPLIFDRHMLKHTREGRYTCSVCSLKFSVQNHLVNHMQSQHNGAKLLPCNRCDKKFLHPSALKRHILGHAGIKPFLCHMCNKSFGCAAAQKRHMSKHCNQKQLSCGKCDQSFQSIDRLHYHLAKHKIGIEKTNDSEKTNDITSDIEELHDVEVTTQKCTQCNLRFKFAHAYDRHMLKHMNKFSCSICPLKYPLANDLIKHIQEEHNGEKLVGCTECDQKFLSTWGLKRHIKTHSIFKTYPCKVCKKVFHHATSLPRHMLIHGGQRDCPCEKCDKIFKDPYALKGHIRRVHGSNDKVTKKVPMSQPNEDTNNKRTPKYVDYCKVCKKGQNSRTRMIEHMRIHTGERPYICDICNNTFRTKGHLIIHMIVHTGKKAGTCEICGVSFTQLNSLTKHMNIHTGSRPHACKLCDKAYKQSSQLFAHVRNVHLKQKNFACELCNARFFCSSGLKKHMVTHTGIKAHTCVKCNNKFATSNSLRRHMTNTCKIGVVR